jgi:hypothetical protein
MALSNLATFANALSQLYAPDIQAQYNRQAVTTSLLPVRPGRGKNVAWDVTFSNAAAASYAEGADVASGEYTTDKKIPASLSWGLYRAAFQLSETAVDAAASSMGTPEELMDLVGDALTDVSRKLISVINNDVINGTGVDGSSNPTFVGLLGGSLAASGTYAGIARATYAEWAGNVLANGGTPRALTVDLMDNLDQVIYAAAGYKYDLILCDPRTFRKYKGLFQSSVVQQIVPGGPVSAYGIGSDTLTYNDVRIIRDKDIPAGNMLFLSSQDLEIQFLPFAGAGDGVLSREMSGEGSNGKGSTPTGVPFRVVPLAKTGDSYKFLLRAQAQLKVKRPNAFGIITDLS